MSKYTTMNDYRLRHLYKERRRLERLKRESEINAKLRSVMITCDTVAEPWYISRKELEANRSYYENDPTIHFKILEEEEGNAGKEV